MAPMQQLVVVTGAFGALGSAVARKFHARGARLGLIDHAHVSDEARQEFQAPHVMVGGVDLTDEKAAAAAFQQVTGGATGLDVLVNVAGGFRFETLAEGNVATWDLMFAMNLKTAVVASRTALPHLKARGAGRIINIGAGAAVRGRSGMGAYTASKAGVARRTQGRAAGPNDRKITVNAILPGTIDTPANRADMPKADVTRWVAPEAIADVIAFLASEDARAVTGAAIRVFGRG
jgi:NAD(P)-dependent dehydrogenase (short-subunit alcohol dehydrogenase family)